MHRWPMRMQQLTRSIRDKVWWPPDYVVILGISLGHFRRFAPDLFILLLFTLKWFFCGEMTYRGSRPGDVRLRHCTSAAGARSKYGQL